MKTSSIFFGAIGICLFASTTLASNVADGDIVTFTANSTAKSADVNQNFNKLKAANNDNDTRITTNTGDITTLTSAVSTKQERVTDTCAVGQAVSAIAANGTVTCETGLNTRLTAVESALAATKTMYYSIPLWGMSKSTWSDFQGGWASSVGLYHVSGNSYFDTPVNLPDGAQVIEMVAYVYDTSAASGTSVALYDELLNSASINTSIAFASTSAAFVGGASTLTSTVTTPYQVNNSTKGIHIRITLSSTSPDTTVGILGIRIKYTVTN